MISRKPAAEPVAYAPATRRAELLDAVAAAIAVILVIFTLTGGVQPLRLLCTVAFTFFVPGRAIVGNWPRLARWSGVGMSIALSLATLTLLAVVTLWIHLWNPYGLFLAEAVASLAGLGVSIYRRRTTTGNYSVVS